MYNLLKIVVTNVLNIFNSIITVLLLACVCNKQESLWGEKACQPK